MQQQKPPMNQGQQDAAEAFFQFLFSEDKEMGISGPGGVGKTFLMGEMIDTILPRYYDTCKMMGIEPEFDFVDMTATTNKAAEALSLATGRPTTTIHSYLNLKVKDDYTNGTSKLMKTASWRVHERTILFLDECSMIDSPLYTCIHEGMHKSKIVYVGDHCQLAPVKEKLSPIYKRGIPFYNLTEPMRTKVPELQALNQQLRETVETGVFKPIQIIPGIIDWLDDEGMQRELQNTFAAQTHESRVLAFTNQRVVQFNDYIRQLRNLPPEWTNGEMLVNNSAIRFKKRMFSVEEEFTIISQASVTEDIDLDGAIFKVRRTTLESRLGERFNDVPLPVDRPHFEALIRYFKKEKNWTKYYHLKNTYPELRQRDAATVHKAQGSTYDTVFIDVGNISTCNIADQVARMLYVAASRARTRVFFFGELHQKYGGLVF